MRILVCISNVPDTTTKIKFTPDNKQFDTSGVQWIINPWDELALTRALELKEGSNGKITEVAVINVGPKDTEITIRKALSMGADSAIRIDTIPLDAFSVASEMAEYIKTDPYDLILCGIESSDYNGNAVGGMLAELINYNSISAVSGIEFNGENFIVYRDIDGGRQKLIAQPPIVAVIQKGIAKEPRIPSMRGIMAARTKPIKLINPKGIKQSIEILDYQLPPSKGKCKMIPADNIAELVRVLHEEIKVI